VLLVVWLTQAVFGLLTSLILIANGYQYRKRLGEG
jgi:hypothetical protein